MTLREFKQLHTAKKWEHFTYLTENQDDILHCIKVSLSFPSMIISDVPSINTIFLKMGEKFCIDGFNGVIFTCVKSVKVEPCVIGDIITICCADKREYILVAD